MAALPFGLALKLSAYLLVLDGFAALLLADVLSAPTALAVAAAIAATWWTDRVRPHVDPRLVTAIGAALAAFLALDVAVLADSFFDSVVHLLLLLLLYKLATWRTSRDAAQLGVLSFFLLVAASAVTVSPGFLLVFVAFLVLGTWTFTLLHLRREVEGHAPGGLRALETARVVTPGFIGVGLLFSLAALGLTAAIFLVLPRVGRAFLPLQARAGIAMTGFSDRVELGAFGPIQTDPTVVMRVFLPDHPEGAPPPEGLRWRGLAFDRFDGTTWSAAELPRWVVPRRLDGVFFLRRPEPGRRPLQQEVELNPVGVAVLLGAPRLMTVAGPMAALHVNEAGAVFLPEPPAARLRYTAYSLPGPPGGPGEHLPPTQAARYLRVPPVSPPVAALARELAGDADTPLEKARRMEEALRRRYRYTLTLRRDPRRDPIEDFLFQQRAGNCEYFAASMALLLRLEGVPARVVNGFQQGEWNEFGRYFTVRQRDAHAWVEAFAPGAGWVTFDPSPRDEFEAERALGAGRAARFLDFLRTRWTRYVVDYSLRDQMHAAQFLRQQTARLREDAGAALGGWLRRVGMPQGPGRWAAAAVLAGGAAAWLFRRRGGRAAGGRGRRGQETRFYARLRRALQRHGFSPAAAETPLELARRAARQAGPALAPAEEITRLYYRVRFGGRLLTPAEAARIESLLAALERPPRERRTPPAPPDRASQDAGGHPASPR